MAFSKSMCDESGVWTGRCSHGQIVVTKGERFPDCAGCRRGIDWLRVDSVGEARRATPRQAFADAADEGWWPGKAAAPHS